jgi:hypothetical protein
MLLSKILKIKSQFNNCSVKKYLQKQNQFKFINYYIISEKKKNKH